MSRIWGAVVREIRDSLPALIFFLLLFHLILATKATLLGESTFTALRATVATLGALIVAKSILIVEKLPVARLFSQRLALHALWKALLFGIVAMLFRFVEELIPLLAKHESLATATARLTAEVSWQQFWVFQLWLFGALILYCLACELVRRVGAGTVRQVLWGPVRSKARGADDDAVE